MRSCPPNYSANCHHRNSHYSAEVLKVSFSPDGKTIASASADKTIKLWNVNGKEMKTLQGYNHGVIDIKFSPDGQTIASVDLDSFRLQKIDGTLLNDAMLVRGCSYLHDYLNNKPDASGIDRALCDGINQSK